MRTTLNIDDDLLLAVKEIARRESKSVGGAVSDLLRKAIAGDESCGPGMAEAETPFGTASFGFRPFPRRGSVVTNELIDRLREESGG
ncbi:MAG: hypothetical protein F4Y03_11215 [Alphaproteobacteria bacterium]|nr:hypothetical protein [Alphaproteobacteria bacterium]